MAESALRDFAPLQLLIILMSVGMIMSVVAVYSALKDPSSELPDGQSIAHVFELALKEDCNGTARRSQTPTPMPARKHASVDPFYGRRPEPAAPVTPVTGTPDPRNRTGL